MSDEVKIIVLQVNRTPSTRTYGIKVQYQTPSEWLLLKRLFVDGVNSDNLAVTLTDGSRLPNKEKVFGVLTIAQLLKIEDEARDIFHSEGRTYSIKDFLNDTDFLYIGTNNPK